MINNSNITYVITTTLFNIYFKINFENEWVDPKEFHEKIKVKIPPREK